MGTSIELRRVDLGDLERITSLLDAARDPDVDAPAEPPIARYRWQLETGALTVGAFAEDRLLGLVSARPRAFRAGGDIVRVAELTDGLVDPVVGGRGVFRALHDELAADLARRDVVAISCMPAPGFGRALRESFRYEKALTVLATESPVRRDRPPRPSPGVEIVRETETGPDYDGLDADLAADRMATVRSAEHLRMRYLEHPHPYELLALRRGQRLEGWLVLRMVLRPGSDPTGVVVDSLFWPEATVQRSASAAALRWCAGQGCGRAVTWRADGPQDPPLFEGRAEKEKRPRRLEYLLRSIRPSGRALLRQTTRSRWRFRPGDTDEF